MKTMRDAFFDELYEIAKKDHDVILMSADVGAPSLDKFRKNLSSQYIHAGVAEEEMMSVATGLALSGKKVFVYSIITFTVARCYEFIKFDLSLMNTPVTIIGVGTGVSYDDAGPTHHSIEDISIMRVLPNLEILNPSDSEMAKEFAKKVYNSNHPVYIRLDRMSLPIKRNYMYYECFDSGFREFKGGKDICIVATGNTVDDALEIQKETDLKIGVIDLYRLKPIHKKFIECLKRYNYIISWEEHLLAGGLGSILSEIITDYDLPVKLKRIGIDDRYCYIYGGRKNIQKKTNIDVETVHNFIKKELKK